MKYTILAIILLCSLFLLSNCTEHDPEVVTVTREVTITKVVTREVIITKVVTPETKNTSEIAYEILPPLDGIPSNLLVNSRWQLERFIIDNVDSPNFVNGQWIQFEEMSWFGFDGCNRISGAYKTNEEGDLLLNLGLSTLLACSIIDDKSEEERGVGDREFVEAIESAVAFEIDDGNLWIFYSDNQVNSLVFSPLEINEN